MQLVKLWACSIWTINYTSNYKLATRILCQFQVEKGEDMSTQVAFEMNKKKIKDDCPIPM